MTQPKYLWLDLETTGLDPREHDILEFAVIVTGADLRTQEEAGGVLAFDLQEASLGIGKISIDQFVRDMHTNNGLWSACKDAIVTPAAMQEFLIGLIEGCAPWVDGKPILAGSTPHFDRAFLREHCPDVDRALHYRHFDVSTLKMAMRDIDGFDTLSTATAFGTETESRHRAASDVEHSLQVARDFQNIVRNARRV